MLRRPPLPIVALGLLLALGCGGDDAAGDEQGEGEAGASTGEDEGPPHPSFAEPASRRLALTGTRHLDIELAVLGVVEGVTELLLDEQTLGPLPEGSVSGQLEPNMLTLYVRGSLVPGQHDMILRTADGTGSDESEPVLVEIAADTSIEPAASLDDTVVARGQHLSSIGHDDHAVLLVLEQTDTDPLLHVLPRSEDGWTADGGPTISLPGLQMGADETSLPVATQRRRVDEGDTGRLRVAWRVDRPGTRIEVVEFEWDQPQTKMFPDLVLDMATARADRTAEWSELRRPWLLGDYLLTELWAPVDVESSRPGDYIIAFARIGGDAQTLDPAQHLALGPDLMDLDGIAPAVDAIAANAGRPAPVSLRADGHRPVILELDPSTNLLGIRSTAVPGRGGNEVKVEGPLASVLGAFGSRTVAGFAAEPEVGMHVSFIDDLGGRVTTRQTPADAEPNVEDATGPIASASIDGLTVFLVPLGASHPVQALFPVGDDLEIIELPGVQCDAVALAGIAGVGSVPLACLRDGEVRLGELTSTTR
ncbi:MAG: hypothetical protein AAF799_08395 [Myxococcota bacterium]